MSRGPAALTPARAMPALVRERRALRRSWRSGPYAGLTPTQTARRYIRRQLATMARFGSRPTLGRRRYWRLVRDVVRAMATA